MIIKSLNTSYIKQIAEIECRVHKNPWSETAILLHLQNPVSISHGIFNDSKLIAYLLGQHFNNEYHILNLAVDIDYQRKGHGKMLLKESINQLFIQGTETCFLEVRQSNSVALNLYKKLGFKIVAVRKRYYQDNFEDALVLTLEGNKIDQSLCLSSNL